MLHSIVEPVQNRKNFISFSSQVSQNNALSRTTHPSRRWCQLLPRKGQSVYCWWVCLVKKSSQKNLGTRQFSTNEQQRCSWGPWSNSLWAISMMTFLTTPAFGMFLHPNRFRSSNHSSLSSFFRETPTSSLSSLLRYTKKNSN